MQEDYYISFIIFTVIYIDICHNILYLYLHIILNNIYIYSVQPNTNIYLILV